MKKLIASLLLLAAAATTAHADATKDAKDEAVYTLARKDNFLRGFPNNPPVAADLHDYDGDGSGDAIVKSGKECLAAVDSAVKAGTPEDTMVKINDAEMTLAEARTKICQPLIDYGTAFEVLADQVVYERWHATAAKYEAIGIKGDRLALFVWYEQYGIEFFTKGCQYTTSEPADLKKAKVLFDWLEGDDGRITVRKYKFKKDKYKVTEMQFWAPEKAYRWCK